MSSFNLPMFILLVIVSIVLSTLLALFTELSVWLAIALSPVASFILLLAFSFIIERLEPKEDIEPTPAPMPKDPSDIILSLRPAGLSCPACGSDQILEIIYGLPATTEKLERELEKKTIILGGCMMHENAPLWKCGKCNCTFDHPISKEHAVKTVQSIIKNYTLPEGDTCIVVESNTIEKEWGWMIFHTSRKYFETNDIKYAVAGNAPIIVLRKNGRAIVTGTAYPAEHYIQRFEQTGDPHG